MSEMKWLQLILAAILAISPLAVPLLNARPTPTPHRIGILGNQDNPPWEGLRQGLHDLGYVEGRNVRIDRRWSDGIPERLPALARELVSLKPDVIVVSGTQAALAAGHATKSIPILVALSQDPEKIGLVQSLSRPGGNVTGLSTVSPQLTAKRLEVLKEVAPAIVRVACLWDSTSLSQQLLFADLKAAAGTAGLTLMSIEARSADAVPGALAAANWTRGDALLVIDNPITFKRRQVIVDFTRANRIPTIFEERLFVELGGLVSYGPDFAVLFRRAATYVDRILRGAKPADLPVEQPVRFELTISLGTARALDLTVPPALRVRADRIFE
jgi:putative ABC transport system substrate-binding protein